MNSNVNKDAQILSEDSSGGKLEKTIHGEMLQIFDLGVLILGESGIGKSEAALDLIRLGHQLISDDSVTVRKTGNRLFGSSPPITRNHLEIRGLGIINVRDIFGDSVIGHESEIVLCVELKRLESASGIDRLGLTMQEEKIFDISIPKFILPVSLGRNITTLVETAVRVFLLKSAGRDAAKELIKRHDSAVGG